MAYGACANDMRSSRDALAKSRFPGVGKGLKPYMLISYQGLPRARPAPRAPALYIVLLQILTEWDTLDGHATDSNLLT